MDEVGEQLSRWGKVATIETRGRVSGRPVRAAVGFIEGDDGSLLIAAGDPDADWARNLEANPICIAWIGDRRAAYAATPLEPAQTNDLVASLILRYGTPAERLGRGPAFRLTPVGGGPARD